MADEKDPRSTYCRRCDFYTDHLALPSYGVVDVTAFVTCQNCKEWLHA